jgi:hypothetical protein
MKSHDSHVISERSHSFIVLTTAAALTKRHKTATRGCKLRRVDSLFLTMDDKLIKPELTASRCDGATCDMSSVAAVLPVACSLPSFESNH